MKRLQKDVSPAATPSMITMQSFLTPGNPYLTPGDVANMLGFLADDVVKRLTESPTLGGRVYARSSDLANRWGVDRRTAADWLKTAEREGKIHPMQGETGRGKDGDVLYHIAEVEAVLKERRHAAMARKAERRSK